MLAHLILYKSLGNTVRCAFRGKHSILQSSKSKWLGNTIRDVYLGRNGTAFNIQILRSEMYL